MGKRISNRRGKRGMGKRISNHEGREEWGRGYQTTREERNGEEEDIKQEREREVEIQKIFLPVHE